MNKAYIREKDALVAKMNILQSQLMATQTELNVLHQLECKH